MKLRSLENLGRVHEALGEKKEGLAKLMEAADLASNQQGSSCVGDLVRILGLMRTLEMDDNNVKAGQAHNDRVLSLIRRHKGQFQEDLLDALIFSGEIALRRRQFREAKNTLLKAKALVSSSAGKKKKKNDEEEAASVVYLTKLLNVVRRVLATLDQFDSVADDDHVRKLTLNKKLGDLTTGDAACWYYKEAIRNAAAAAAEESVGGGGMPVTRMLADLYTSMAEVKREMGHFQEAVSFYEKELDLLKEDRPGEAAKTLVAIYLCDQDPSDVGSNRLMKALSLAEKSGSDRIKTLVLTNLVEAYEHMALPAKAQEFRMMLKAMPHNAACENESGESDSDADLPLSEINLEISDQEEEDDTDLFSKPKTSRRQHVKGKNEKGNLGRVIDLVYTTLQCICR